ncbi:MAG: glycoside hydrolase [Verrucomicrobiae bacterium]|nr:glycoside hydrolase [Verrucomicrobiae bacterium]
MIRITALLFGCACNFASAATLENRALRVEVSPDTGRITVTEKSTGQLWEQPAETKAKYRILDQTKHELNLQRSFDITQGRKLPLKLRLTLPTPDAPDLRVEVSADDPKTEIAEFAFLEPFLLDAPRGVLAVADYGNGHLYPLHTQPFPRTHFGADRLDMPWVGICDLDSGRGYLLLLETSDDAAVVMQKTAGKDGRPLVAPVVRWRPQKGTFGYPRSLLYHFTPRGGYVALCKRYRAYARAQGLVVPFTEKLKKNPNIARLFGAPDVWGDASLRFAQEAKAAGIEKMIIHGRAKTPEEMRAINALGYLTSEYDNYTDILQSKDGTIDRNHGILPDHAVMLKDGERMKAWLTWDKKTQYMKRCPALWVETAKLTVEKVLREWPFLGRFVDVTTAESLYECYDPKHPLTRSQKRECGPALLRVFRDRGLVIGGEHGIWWCVPWVDYIEGMMSHNPYFSWPAGHLIRPKTKDQEFEGAWGKIKTKWADYEKWGIGHQWRAPLWELVFHDCIVSTWYWGDATDWLMEAAPEITPKKDAFNILYGTIPLLWANKQGAWHQNRDLFLRSYRNTCKLHEAIATAEMLSHEFLTPDHALQRTRFSDGTECIVNFGETPQRVSLGGKEFLLPQNGWAVRGPKIEQSLTLENGKLITRIRAGNYQFTETR